VVCGSPWPEEHRTEWSQVEKGHGRLETRVLERLVCPPRLRGFWPGVQQVLRRTCQTMELPSGRQRQTEITYALTSLTPVQADLPTLATVWRGHWTMETRVHHVLACTWGEDACQVRTGAAPVAVTLGLPMPCVQQVGPISPPLYAILVPIVGARFVSLGYAVELCNCPGESPVPQQQTGMSVPRSSVGRTFLSATSYTHASTADTIS
jgi:hypothetical protein